MLGNLSRKQIFLFGFLLILGVAIPVTLYLIRHQQHPGAGATRATVVSFDSSTSSDGGVIKHVNPNDTVDLPIFVDPKNGQTVNTVSVVTIQITFNPKYLQVADPTTCINSTGALANVVTKATCSNSTGSALVRLAASSVSNFITTKTEIADIKFLVNPNVSGSTQVTFGGLSQADSSQNQDPESSVIASTQPATLYIGNVQVPTLTNTPTPTTVGAATPTDTPTPTTSLNPPVCSSLTTDVGTSGTAPYTITFTANGQPQGSATLSKATFNFGDGTVQDVSISNNATDTPTSAPTDTPTPTTSAPTDTPTETPTPTTAQSVAGSAQLAHTYAAGGSYNASVTFTDSSGAVSVPGNCTQTITISGPTATPGGPKAANPTATSSNPPTATPTVAATGPGEQILGIGVAGAVLTIVGGLLFFIL